MERSEQAVVETIRAMYAAAAVDDDAALARIFTADFYAFDLGKRFQGMALAELIKTAHAAGKRFVWTVTEPDVHVVGDLAWLSFVNSGSVGDAAGTAPVTWLESAVLRFEEGRWRVQFFHSTRVPPAD
jgi:ketosteroid isomerase-like protein